LRGEARQWALANSGAYLPSLFPPRPARFEDEDEEEEDFPLSSVPDFEALRCGVDDGEELLGAASRLESGAEPPRLAEGGAAVLEP
jgi:hypothetical protein